MLRAETAKALGNWIFEDILCQWGALSEIVMDNGALFVKDAAYLEKKYHVKHIQISSYNSCAKGIVKFPHFDIRQGLFKAADGEECKWSQVAHSVFWSERVTVRRCMGCSPYFAVTGTQPILPLDIVEATYLIPVPVGMVTTMDLIAS